jgi:hypothetical protein
MRTSSMMHVVSNGLTSEMPHHELLSSVPDKSDNSLHGRILSGLEVRIYEGVVFAIAEPGAL